MEIAKLTRNTISISYNLDKVAQVGYFVLSLFKDNQPVYVKEVPSVTYYRKGTADIKTWSPTVKDGFVYLNANDFSDIHKSGTYYITCILSDGDIYPSQGSAILTLEGDLPETSEVQIQPITGANGKDGAGIVNIQLDKTQSHFIFTLSDGQTIETSVSMPDAVKGDKGEDGLSAYQIAVKDGFSGTETEWLQSLKGQKGDSITGPQGPKGDKGDSITGPAGQDGQPGKDAPHVTRVTYADNQLTFTFSDSSSLSTPFVMPVPENGKNGTDGKDGKNAPTIENVNYADNELMFTFSDGSKKSTSFVMPIPKNGENGTPGKDAPVVTSVNYDNNQLNFMFSDGTTKSTSFVMPTPVNGKDGTSGKDGKDAPTITNVDLNDDQTQIIFTFSDGKKLQTDFKAPEAIAGPKGDKGQDGTPGKDAPKITSVRLNDDQTKIIFTLSDSSELQADINLPKPKDGKDGKDGTSGLSAYQVAVKNGFKGTEKEWLQSLKGPKGDKGDSITGPKGEKGDSITGPAGQNGKDAPHVTRVTYNDNQLSFTFSDGSSLSTPFIMPVPTNGKDGLPGKDAPSITDVKYADNQLTFSFSDGASKSTSFVMPTPTNGKDGKNGQDAPTVTSVAYDNDQLTFNFSDGTSKSTSFKVTSSDSNVKDTITVTTSTHLEFYNREFDTSKGYLYLDDTNNRSKLNPNGSSSGIAITRSSPNFSIYSRYYNSDISLKKGISDRLNFDKSGLSSEEITFKPIFDELDTKANKSDVPTNETLTSQIDQNLKEKLKKNIVSKITPPGFVDDTGTRVQSGLAISSYNLNGDYDTMRYTPTQIVALNNYGTGYSYNIPISKLSVNDQYGSVSMVLQGSLTGEARPKKFSIGKTDIVYPDPSNAEIVLSTDNKQKSAYSSNVIQIRNRSDYFSGLPVTVVNANIKEQTPEARQAFKNAFSDFNEKFYFLHIEG